MRRPALAHVTTLCFALALAVLFGLSPACTKSDPVEGGDSGVAEDAAKSDAPLLLDLWAGVPPLTPTGQEVAAEVVPKPGPLKPKAVSETIEVPFPPPAPPVTPATPAPGEIKPLTVERFGPIDDVGLVDSVRVSFSEAIVPLADVETLAAKDMPIEIDPKPPGEPKWLGTKAFAYMSKGRLPYSTTYNVRVPAGLEATNGAKLESEKRWAFTTPALVMTSSDPYGGSTNVSLEPTLTLGFNQAVQRIPLLAAVKLRGGGETIALDEFIPKTTSVPDEAAREREARVVRLRPKKPLQPNTSYSVSIPAGVFGEGPNRSAASSFSFSTYPPLKVAMAKCESPCWASGGINLETTTSVSDPLLEKKVHISPEVENLSVSASYNGIYIRGDFEGLARYSVEVDAGLVDAFGQKLAKPFKGSIKFGPLAPSLGLLVAGKSPAVIDRGPASRMTVRASGLSQLEIHARALGADEIGDFLNDRWGRDYGWPEDSAPATYAETFDISASQREVQKLNLDLDRLLAAGSGKKNVGWFLAKSNEYTNYGYTQRLAFSQMFEVTDLGITAALDNDSGTLLVTRFSDNSVVPGAKLTVYDQNNAKVWSGTTASTGMATMEISALTYPQYVVADAEGDVAFMRLDSNDARSRYLQRGSYDDQPRAFFFTDRTPYKPGEEIHLSGIIRLETRGPQGAVKAWRAGATGNYTVSTPRGIEVAKGEIKLTDFGSFSVDIKTEEEQGTGDYQFRLDFSSLFGANRNFYHSIPVETFRTPEFAVKVERPDSTPLMFEKELVANVQADYLHGAPLVGAQANYTVTRTDTGFSPPGELSDGFSFGASSGGRDRYAWSWWTPPSRQVAAGAATTDATGKLEIKHLLAKIDPPPAAPVSPEPEPTKDETDPGPPMAATYVVNATVVDENRQAISAMGSFVVHAASIYVGLRSERSVLREGEKTNVEAIVADLNGERVTDTKTDVKVIRRVTERKAIEKNGAWTYKYETTEEVVSTCVLVSRGVPVKCEVTAGKPGTYVVRGEALDSEARPTRSEITLYVHGDDAVIWEDQQKRVDLVPDRSKYEPGDTVKLLVRSPFDQAKGLVVVERDGIADEFPVTIEGGAASIEIPITASMVAGVTVSAILVKGRTEVPGAPEGQDLGMPAVATGLVEIDVSTQAKQIAVELVPSATEIEPKGKLTVDITTKDGAGQGLPASLAIMVVDEGVLSLMNYQTPDPLSFFVHKRPGNVWLQALHSNIMPRQAASEEVLGGGPEPTEPEPEADDVWGALEEGSIGEAYGVGGLGLRGTGMGGGGSAADEAAPPPAPSAAAPGAQPRPKAAAARIESKKSSDRRAEKTKDSSKASGTFDAAAAMAQGVSLRTLFATTAFFDAEVHTDAFGKASVTIDMPENLTSFRIMAVALDPETPDRFGSADTSVRVRKPIMIRPSLPRFANFGDRFEASIMVDNQTGVDQKVLVGTRGLNVKLDGEDQKFVDIPAGGSKEVRFHMAAEEVGTMRLQFAAMSSGGRDATEMSLPVQYPATAEAFADYGMTSDSIERALETPANALPGYGGLELTFSSTALSGLEDSVQYLVDYEYECAEQTASRMLPIFVLGKILDEFPIASVRDQVSRELLTRGGIRKLFDKQGYDGGFGYWKSEESWPYVSTWATFALLEGKRAGYTVDEAKLSNALNYVENFVRYGHVTRWGHYYDWTTRAFGLWLLSREGRGADMFDRVWAQRDKVPLYARAMLMSAAHRYKKIGPRDEVLAELRAAVVESPRTIHFAESTSEGDADGLRVLMHSNVQTDAIVLMALLEVSKDDPMLPKIIAGILSERDPRNGGRWSTTHANAWALLAASRYYETVEADEPNFDARVWLDEQYAGEFAFKGRSMTQQQQLIPMKTLLANRAAKLMIGKEGAGKLYYRLGLSYAPEDLRVEAQEQGFVVYREYEALTDPGQDPDPDAVKRLEDGSWVVKAGTNIRVTINLVVRDRANYVVVDDGLPAGFEGQNPRFVTSVATESSSPSTTGGLRWWYPWWTFDYTEMRDDRMLLFADHLPAGVYTYSYTARATSIGEFQLPPIKAEAMYEPERFGHSSSSKVRVVE